MKVRVNRQLISGVYHVNFEVADFTPEEITKMNSFGIPVISLRWTQNNIDRQLNMALTHISKSYDASFANQDEAQKYEEGVIEQIRVAMKRLRESLDKYSSSEEVAL
jgi:hypothetical protein